MATRFVGFPANPAKYKSRFLSPRQFPSCRPTVGNLILSSQSLIHNRDARSASYCNMARLHRSQKYTIGGLRFTSAPPFPSSRHNNGFKFHCSNRHLSRGCSIFSMPLERLRHVSTHHLSTPGVIGWHPPSVVRSRSPTNLKAQFYIV